MSKRESLREAAYWFAGGCLLWWLLSGGEGWWFGIASSLFASVMAFWLKLPFWRLRLLYLPRFTLFFFREVTLAGWDVASRACHPRLPIAPAWVTYPLTQSNPRVSLLLSAMVGLLPGTLASRVGAGQLTVHTLNQTQAWQHSVAALEQQLSRLLGEES